MTELRDITTALSVAMEARDQPLTNEILVELTAEVGEGRASNIARRCLDGLSLRSRAWWLEEMQPASTMDTILRDGFEAAMRVQRRRFGG